MKTWNVADAKSHFSNLLNESNKKPQLICKHNTPVAVVINISEYEKTSIKKEPEIPTVAELFNELRQIQQEEPIELEIPERRDRSSASSLIEDDLS